MSRVSVCVACRVRPLAEADETFVTLHNKTVYIRDPDQPHLTPQVFGFDCGFDAHATNRNVYEEVAMPVLQQALQGYNGTIFAYGQTGSGKTHTMHGWGQGEEEEGIVPRLSRDLFREFAARADTSRFLVTASYLEIYNEQIVDLFNPTDQALTLRQHPQHGVFVPELAQLVVRSDSELRPLVAQGNRARHVAATGANERSSRAHSVLSLRVEQQSTVNRRDSASPCAARGGAASGAAPDAASPEGRGSSEGGGAASGAASPEPRPGGLPPVATFGLPIWGPNPTKRRMAAGDLLLMPPRAAPPGQPRCTWSTSPARSGWVRAHASGSRRARTSTARSTASETSSTPSRAPRAARRTCRTGTRS